MKKSKAPRKQSPDRRDFIKKVGYTAPAVLTLAAAPAFAQSGSSGTVVDTSDRRDT